MIAYEDILIRVFIVNAMFIWGLYLAFKVEFHDDENPQLGYNKDSRGIFWKVKYWSLKNLGTHWSKLVCTCPVCMSSLHSIILYTLFLWSINWQWQYALGWLLWVPCLAFANYLIVLITEKWERG